MLINARTSRFLHRTLSPEFVVFVTLRRRASNVPPTQWKQERWRAEQFEVMEETDGAGGAMLTVRVKRWALYNDDPTRDAPRVGDQLVEEDGTVTELNSARPIKHGLFRNYVYECDGVIQGVN